MQCTCMKDFNHEVLRPMYNFNDTAEMFIEASPHYRVSDIPIPVVAMNAVDDPFCPRHGKHAVSL